MKISAIQTYLRLVMLKILGLGFISGLPLALTGSTMAAYLQDNAVNLADIGLFSLVAMPYTLKFAWAPLLDQTRLPLLSSILGHRKSWIILLQLLMMMTIYSMSLVDMQQNLPLFAALALMTSLLSASQDVVIDALRIEMLPQEDQGIGATVAILGYRLGMLASGAGALYISHYHGWPQAYISMSILVSIGILTTLSCKEAEYCIPKFKTPSLWLEHAFVRPVSEFVKRGGWLNTMLFIVFFKMSDAFAGSMTTPFLMDIGFNKGEIASIVKVYGLTATLLGFVVGGSLIKSLGYYRSLFWGVILEMTSNWAFVAQAIAGHDNFMLMINISVENFASGISAAALVAYISHLCNREFTATQYALFSAIAVMARTTLSASSGFMAEGLGWVAFFITTSLLSLPALYLLKHELKKGE